MDTFARQRQLVGTTAEWAANDLVVGYGEFAIELVSPGKMRAKLGDGVSVFSALAYFDPSVTSYVNKAGDTMTGALVLPELDAVDAAFSGTVDLGAGAIAAEPADNDNTQRVPSTHWVQARVSGIITGLKLLGTWNAATNSPTLANGVGTRGDFYMVAVPGSTPLDGITSWAAGDSVVFNGVAWQKVPQALNAAQIVAGLGYTPANKAGDTFTGRVTLTPPAAESVPLMAPGNIAGNFYAHVTNANAGANAAAGYGLELTSVANAYALLMGVKTATPYVSLSLGVGFTGGFVLPPVTHATAPAAGDNSDLVPTTAWVKANGTPPPAVQGFNAAQVNCGPAGTYANVATTGAIGAAGQKWLIQCGANVGNASASYDFFALRIWNGAAAVGAETVVSTVNGGGVYAGCCSLVTLTGATTFTLQAKDGSTANGFVTAGTGWISAIRVS